METRRSWNVVGNNGPSTLLPAESSSVSRASVYMADSLPVKQRKEWVRSAGGYCTYIPLMYLECYQINRIRVHEAVSETCLESLLLRLYCRLCDRSSRFAISVNVCGNSATTHQLQTLWHSEPKSVVNTLPGYLHVEFPPGSQLGMRVCRATWLQATRGQQRGDAHQPHPSPSFSQALVSSVTAIRFRWFRRVYPFIRFFLLFSVHRSSRHPAHGLCGLDKCRCADRLGRIAPPTT